MRVDLKWPDELVREIDSVRGSKARSAWIREACETRLRWGGAVPEPVRPLVSRADAFRRASSGR